MTDVFIIGGGPAGLATAIAARQRGLSVTVADGNRPPIDKACGEGLMPDSRAELAQLGVDLPASTGHEFRGIRFHGAGRAVDANFPGNHAIAIRRTVLHQAIIDAATAQGVELRWGTPVSSLQDASARWVVGADGAASRVRRMARLETAIWNSRRFATRQHFAIEPWTDFMEIYWGERFQIYITPVGCREVCVALISDHPHLQLSEVLPLFPKLHFRLRGAPTSTRARGAVTVNLRLRAVTRGNVALIGDASGSVDAITGEGLCLSFRQARLLAAAMADGNLAAYNRAHRLLAIKPWLMSKAMLTLGRGTAFRQLAMGAMAMHPGILRTLLAVHVA